MSDPQFKVEAAYDIVSISRQWGGARRSILCSLVGALYGCEKKEGVCTQFIETLNHVAESFSGESIEKNTVI